VYHESSQQAGLRLSEWAEFKQKKLPQLNQQLRDANLAPINIAEIEREAGSLISQ